MTETPSATIDAHHHAEQHGYSKGLKARQVQMIAIGGAIGTGLFMGAGGRLHDSGPALMLVYALCGVFAFLILRAMGELVLHRPSSGSFVSYAREFYGEKAAFASGWLYWLNWAMTSIVDVTAIALYVDFFGKYWAPISAVPQWIWALAALVVVLSLNIVSVKVFGELEFWFALIKVTALVTFLVVGICFVLFGTEVDGRQAGLSMITDHGGFFPEGLLAPLIVIQGVVFAYAVVELVGTTAGETEHPERIIPRAINTVILRILVFYVGSVLLLTMLLPAATYHAGESPFVTFFSHVGVDGADGLMDLVVLTAALSSLNAGLYSTGRILRSMAMAGSAPSFAERMSRSGVPYGGILITALVTLLGVGLNAVVPDEAFEIVLNISAVGIVASWGTIILCQLRLFSWAKQGIINRPAFRMFGAPYTGYLTLAFLAAVLALMAFDYPVGTWTIGATLVVVIPALVLGWYAVRARVMAIAHERSGWTGPLPVIAARPLADSEGLHAHDD
jgi:L-asparagine permease